MFKAIGQFFAVISSFFSAFEKIANAVNSLASVAENHADTFHKEAILTNQGKLENLKKQFNVETLPETKPTPNKSNF